MSNIISNQTVVQTVRTRVLSLLQRRNGSWSGSMTELLTAITAGRQAPELFPASPSSLRRVINRVVPSLRREGFEVRFTRTTDHARRRLVSFTTRTPRTRRSVRKSR